MFAMKKKTPERAFCDTHKIQSECANEYWMGIEITVNQKSEIMSLGSSFECFVGLFEFEGETGQFLNNFCKR